MHQEIEIFHEFSTFLETDQGWSRKLLGYVWSRFECLSESRSDFHGNMHCDILICMTQKNIDVSTFFRLFSGSPGTFQEASWMIASHLEGRMRLSSDPMKVVAGSEKQQQVENMAQLVGRTEGFVSCPVAEALQVSTQCENAADQWDFSLRARLYESSRGKRRLTVYRALQVLE